MLLRQYARLGSSLSILVGGRFRGKKSVTNHVHRGSSLSLRSWARLRSAILVTGIPEEPCTAGSLRILACEIFSSWFVTVRGWEYASWVHCVSGSVHTPRIVFVFEEQGAVRRRQIRRRLHDSGFFYVFAKLCTAGLCCISCRFRDSGFFFVSAELVAAEVRCIDGRFPATRFAVTVTGICLFGFVFIVFCGCGRIGSNVSVTNYFHMGSSLSLRSWARLGSATLVTGFMNVGSLLSLRSWSQLGSASLVVGFMTVEFLLLPRQSACLGSAQSFLGSGRVRGKKSVTNHIRWGSSLSLRSWAQLGSAMLVTGFIHAGSFLSLRSWARLGSVLFVVDFLALRSSLLLQYQAYLSFVGNGRVGGNVLVNNVVHVGSSLSLTSYVGLCSSSSCLGSSRIGGNVSVTNYIR